MTLTATQPLVGPPTGNGVLFTPANGQYGGGQAVDPFGVPLPGGVWVG